MSKKFLEDSPLQECDSKHFGLDVSLTHIKNVIEHLKEHKKRMIVISAPWGHGKSSLINCLKAQKQEKTKNRKKHRNRKKIGKKIFLYLIFLDTIKIISKGCF